MKKKILLAVTYTEAIIAILAMSAMDSPDLTIPVILLAQAAAWLGLFAKARERRRKCAERS